MFKTIAQLSLLTLMVTAFNTDRHHRDRLEADQFMTVLKTECEKYGLPDSYNNVMVAHAELKSKLQQIITDIRRETWNKDVHAVVRSSCGKLPDSREGFTKFFKSMELCTKPDKRGDLQNGIKAFEEILDFLCANDGESVISFLSEGGPACMDAVKADIASCALPTLNKYSTEKPTANIEDEEEKCRDVPILKNCVLDNMKTCPKPGPARFMDSLFTIVTNHMPCNATSTNEIN